MRARLDANHHEIVNALERLGATVTSIAGIGCGCPDILAGYRGQNYLIEVKDGTLPPSRRALTPDEREWHDTWRGQVAIVETVDDAIRLLTGRR